MTRINGSISPARVRTLEDAAPTKSPTGDGDDRGQGDGLHGRLGLLGRHRPHQPVQRAVRHGSERCAEAVSE